MFIAEIGINHNGDLSLAKRLIDMAKSAGADIVKFQKRTPELCIPHGQKNVKKDTPWGEMTYLEYRKKVEFGQAEYDEIDKYCRENKIQWTASVWDVDSFDFIKKYNVPFVKIPSACITDKELLTEINKSGMAVVMSTGMSTLGEIKNAIDMLKDSLWLGVLHCNSTYPSTLTELNLNTIKSLKQMFPTCTIGYSGHEEGVMPTVIAKVLGAKIVERHITLNKEMWGSDHKASLDFEELSGLIKTLNELPEWLGDGVVRCYPSEEMAKQKLRRFKNI